ncbi:MAG: SMP-30/gluconolactonase/LRE family protein [Bacteroidetes bacterium]|nr:SMP-30/gluconolactonase/LRE family protein [Bacteroidota bacterium]
MKKSQKLLLGTLTIGWLIYFLYKTITVNGIFLKIEPFSEFKSEIIASEPGIEDITIDQETGIAYFSSHDRRNPESLGKILSADIKKDTLVFNDLSSKFKLNEFRPHGISFLKLKDKRKFLFVISHGKTKHDVLKFEILGDSLKYLNRYSSSEFISPNDLLAVGENQFFVTNDHNTRTKWKVFLFDFFRIPTGNVVYFDGNRAKAASDKICYPNGINISDDGTKIFLTSTLEKKIFTFRPSAASQTLELTEEAPIKYSPDNIEKTVDGKLLVACHPKNLAFLSHRKSEKNLSPSAIFEINQNNLKEQNLIFLDDGSKISGSSVAAPFENRDGKNGTLVGCVFDKKILKLSTN